MKDTRTRPTAESKYEVKTYNKQYYFNTLDEAVKFARKRQKQNTCTSVEIYEIKREGFNIVHGAKIEF